MAWSTNVSSGTKVLYGTDRARLDQVAETPWGALTHRVTLKKLAPGTTYYYEVVSDQALGTGGKIESGVAQFTTKDKTQAAGRVRVRFTSRVSRFTNDVISWFRLQLWRHS